MANRFYYTTDDLIASIKKRASIPDSQNMISDDEILEYANDEFAMNLMPLIVSKHEDYYLTKEIIPIEAGKTAYEIPYRAIGNKIQDVYYMPSRSDELNLYEMHRVSSNDISTNNRGDNHHYYYLQNENIVLHVNPTSLNIAGAIVVYYHLRPNALVLTDRSAIVETIDRVNGIITFTATPPSHFTINTQYDFIKTRSPHKLITFDIDATEINSSGKFMRLDPDDIPTTLVVGDRICTSGESDLVNAPTELHSLLAQMTASIVLASIGDNDNLAVSEKRVAKMEMNTGVLIDNRVTGSPFKAKNNNGILRKSGLRRRRRFRAVGSD